MNIEFKPLTIPRIKEIQSWKYKGYMKNLYMKPYFVNYEKNGEIKGPDNCDGYGAFSQGKLIGLFECYFKESLIEVGLALNPLYVGKGLSYEFIRAGIDFLIKRYQYKESKILLTVDKGNYAAYHAYLKVGFRVIGKNKEEFKMVYDL